MASLRPDLDRLRQISAVEDLTPPSEVIQLATLDPGCFVALTPMLAERFGYAGGWRYAGAGQHWLSAAEMESVWRDTGISDQLEVRRENWEDSVLTRYPPSRLSLFAIEPLEGDETYLVWPARGDAAEPAVVSYSGQHSHRFAHLAAYLKWLLVDA